MSTADDHRTYSIRQLCREFGATARALRFYEDKGLLTPNRKGQTRVYDARDRARLKLILRGRRIGFSPPENPSKLEPYDRPDPNAQPVCLAPPHPRRAPSSVGESDPSIQPAPERSPLKCRSLAAWVNPARAR